MKFTLTSIQQFPTKKEAAAHQLQFVRATLDMDLVLPDDDVKLEGLNCHVHPLGAQWESECKYEVEVNHDH